MCARIDSYLELFASVSNVPQEPLLLLTALDLVAARRVNRNFFDLSPAWEEELLSYCKLFPGLSIDEACGGFITLADSGFWHPVPRPESVQEREGPVRSLKELRALYLGARVDDYLYPLLVMETSREKLRAVLHATCFTGEQRLFPNTSTENI